MQAERLTGSGASSNSSHIVIVLSHPIRYMTNDIPYPFHQNQDFLYLTGIMEPDSALVMYGSGKPDQVVLFVPRRDPARELWDGPRSGKDGAAALTGLERVHSTEELGVVLKSLKGILVWEVRSKKIPASCSLIQSAQQQKPLYPDLSAQRTGWTAVESIIADCAIMFLLDSSLSV